MAVYVSGVSVQIQFLHNLGMVYCVRDMCSPNIKMYYGWNIRNLRISFKIIALVCLIVTVLMYQLIHSDIKWYLVRRLLGDRCKDSLGPTPADDLARIRSLKLEGVEQYMESSMDNFQCIYCHCVYPYTGYWYQRVERISRSLCNACLFPPLTNDLDVPELPVFVTALSSDHYNESLYLLQHLKETVRTKYPDLRVIVYSLGMTSHEVKSVTVSCSCDVRIFQFDIYPNHIRKLHSKAWKPLVIQSVAKEHPLVFWLDASVRFKTSDLDTLIADVKRNWVMADDMGLQSTGTIAERTFTTTFSILQESPCLYDVHGEKHTGLVLILANRFITNYFMRPWVSCALTFGCLEPSDNSTAALLCPLNDIPHKRHICHRFDHSIFGILYVRLYHQEMKKHAINRNYFMFCRFPGMNASCEHAGHYFSSGYFHSSGYLCEFLKYYYIIRYFISIF